MLHKCIYSWLFVLYLITLALLSSANGQFKVHLESNGAYHVSVNEQRWLTSAPTFFHVNGMLHSTSDGSLKQAGQPTDISGKDTLGDWNGQILSYVAGGAKVSVSVRTYDVVSGKLAIFTQSFDDDFHSTATSDADSVTSGFPAFAVGATNASLGYLAYNGVFAGWEHNAAGRWTKDLPWLFGGLKAGPLLIFDKSGSVLVISAFDNFMAASYEHDVIYTTVSWGIMGKVNSIPKGFQYSTIMFYGAGGINKAMMRWGETLRQWYGRGVNVDRQLDVSNDYIGYYTDNGAFYYYLTEIGMNYEQTLLEVQKYAKANDILYRYLQYDSWFYEKVHDAVVTWDAMPSIFPHGMQYLYNKTRLPVVAHNRYWSDTTPYAKQNGGPFNFIFNRRRGFALPDDQSFWDFLLCRAKSWGMTTYEQDWLDHQTEWFGASDLTLGTRWVTQIGEAARRCGLTVQFCMTMPRHVLAALLLPSVTQVRASGDYPFTRKQFQIGISSLFIHALGMVPFKDTFWSSRIQPGNSYNNTEDNPKLQAVVSLLSTGPVGVSDRIGHTDVDLVRRLATSSGLLLHPSRPATAIDSQMLQAAFRDGSGPQGQVWTTESVISGWLFGIIFAVELAEPYSLQTSETGWDGQLEPSYVYTSKYFMGSRRVQPFDASTPLSLETCGNYTSMCLYYTSPLLRAANGGKFFLAGEMSKALPMSPKRVRSITTSTVDTTVELVGTPGELVQFDVCDVADSGLSWSSQGVHCRTVTCKITVSGTATLSVLHSTCY